MMNTKHRLSYSVCMLIACAVLLDGVTSVEFDRRGYGCVPEMCWSATITSDRCAAECERWSRPVDEHVHDALMLPVAGALVNRRAPSHFVRIGKTGITDANKRYSSFVRVGRPAPSYKRYSSFVRIGRADQDLDAPHREVYNPSSAFNKRRYSSFVRIGRSVD